MTARLMALGKELAGFMALAQREHDRPLPDRLPGYPVPMVAKGMHESAPCEFPFAGRQVGYSDLVQPRIARGSLAACRTLRAGRPKSDRLLAKQSMLPRRQASSQ